MYQDDDEENFVPKIDFSDLHIYQKRIPHTAREREAMKHMGDSKRTEEEIEHDLKLESLCRRYVPPKEDIQHFFLTRTAITEKQNATMNESVDTYIDQLKKTLPPLQQRISPRFMEMNELPLGFTTNAKSGKKSIARVFDRSGYYDSKQKKLSANLPDIYITQQFKEFVLRGDERVPQVLLESKISLPPGVGKSPRHRRKQKRGIPSGVPM